MCFGSLFIINCINIRDNMNKKYKIKTYELKSYTLVFLIILGFGYNLIMN